MRSSQIDQANGKVGHVYDYITILVFLFGGFIFEQFSEATIFSRVLLKLQRWL